MRTFSVLLLCVLGPSSWADDPGEAFKQRVKAATAGKLLVNFEYRARLESRTASEFGNGEPVLAEFIRARTGLSYEPTRWLRLSAMGQDARAPFLGRSAPGSMRDPFDVQEAYVELFGKSEKGFSMDVGRRMIQYGDTRLIGAPQWAYTARTYDVARASWKAEHARFDVLFVSPIKPDGNRWNRPLLGDHVLGMYNNFRRLPGNASVDVYALRHERNRAGGYTGVGSFRTDSVGARWSGHLGERTRYTGELVIQRGRIGNDPHAAHAWVVALSRKASLVGRPLELGAEWKYASGSSESGRSGTFDQIYPAAHDKLGHADVLGWRNVRNYRVTATWAIGPKLSIVAMFSDSWLADTHDAAYNAQGKAIARSPNGLGPSHAGREADLFATYKRGPVLFGAGAGHFFPGAFFKQHTPGLGQRLLYVFQTYSF